MDSHHDVNVGPRERMVAFSSRLDLGFFVQREGLRFAQTAAEKGTVISRGGDPQNVTTLHNRWALRVINMEVSSPASLFSSVSLSPSVLFSLSLRPSACLCLSLSPLSLFSPFVCLSLSHTRTLFLFVSLSLSITLNY